MLSTGSTRVFITFLRSPYACILILSVYLDSRSYFSTPSHGEAAIINKSLPKLQFFINLSYFPKKFLEAFPKTLQIEVLMTQNFLTDFFSAKLEGHDQQHRLLCNKKTIKNNKKFEIFLFFDILVGTG